MESSGMGQRADDNVEHEAEHDANIREELEDASAQAAITNAAVAAGATPTKAEYDSLVGKFNAQLQVLRDAGLIPSA